MLPLRSAQTTLVITFHFNEPVCRACCNLEGYDRIGAVIKSAKTMIRFSNPQWRAALAAGVANLQLQASLMMKARNNPASKQPEVPLKIQHHHKADEQKIHHHKGDEQKIHHHKADEQKIIHQNADELLNLPAFEDIIQMLAALNRSTPFRIRFQRDMTVFGRVIGFYTKSCLLKVMTEYPIYSGEVLSCATQAANRMLMDFRLKQGEGSLKPGQEV
uniref:Uncharacterized protein n=1 Tax=Amphimedon queenslandica TaxID=400682 RepID=A0A1X7UQI3_AMPQE